MPLDTSIALQAKLPQIEGPLDSYSKMASLQSLMNQNKIQGIQAQQAQTNLDEDQAFKNALRGTNDPSNPDMRQLMQASPTKAIALQKSLLDQQKTQMDIAKQRLELTVKIAPQVMANPTMASANAAIDQIEKVTGTNQDNQRLQIAKIGENPDGIRQWAAGHSMDAKELLPKFQHLDTGGAVTTGTSDPLTGKFTQNGVIDKTVSPDTTLKNNTEVVKADPFGILGLNKNPPNAGAGAGLSGDEYLKTLPPGVASQVKSLSEGKTQISPQLMRSPQGSALLQMAMQYEPGTDQTVYQSRAATAKDAASGKLATSNNALNTVSGHLAGLADTADKLNNTSIPWVNSVKNWVSNAAGNPEVKAFNLNMQGVADELERAYRGAGGSEGSIALWRKNLGDSSSPEQFKSVLAKGAEMLQSKLEANQAQYIQGMHGKPGDYQSITPQSAQAFAKLRGIPVESISGGSPQGNQSPNTSSTKKNIMRTGTLNGRKVVQYSDGTTDYAD